jgi:zinc transporter, ZIP family
MDLLVLVLAATATAVATGLGAVPVFFLGERAATLRPWLLGFAAGVMSVASIVGLLLPALDEGSLGEAALGTTLGVGFLLVSRWVIDAPRSRVAAERLGTERRTALLVFLVLLVHSLPEGFAIGTAYASDTEGLSLFVILAIGAQNVPEGTSVAIPLAAAGYGRARQFWAAVGTSAPQPVGAVIAYVLVEEITGLLPISFAFAAGAMLALVALELGPSAFRSGHTRLALFGTVVGAAVMLALSALLGV